MEEAPRALYEYGVLGIGIVVLGFALYKMFNIIMNDRDKAIQQRDTLLEDFFTKIIPALENNTTFFKEHQTLYREIVLVLKDNDNALKENTAALREFGYMVRSGRGGHSPPPGGT